jgi:hypothetical protein
MSQTASYILLQPRIETGIVPKKEKTIQNVDLIFHVLHTTKISWVHKILTITEQKFALFTSMLKFNSIGHMIFFLSIVSLVL